MINGSEISTQTLDNSSDCIELKHEPVRDMYSQVSEFPAGMGTHQSVNEQFKLATEPILRQVEKLCALLADRTDWNTAGSFEATDSRREDSPVAQRTTCTTAGSTLILIFYRMNIFPRSKKHWPMNQVSLQTMQNNRWDRSIKKEQIVEPGQSRSANWKWHKNKMKRKTFKKIWDHVQKTISSNLKRAKSQGWRNVNISRTKTIYTPIFYLDKPVAKN